MEITRILARRSGVQGRAPTPAVPAAADPVVLAGLGVGAVWGAAQPGPLAADAGPSAVPAGQSPAEQPRWGQAEVAGAATSPRPYPGLDPGAELGGWPGGGDLTHRAGGLPHEVVFHSRGASCRGGFREVLVEADEAAVLADWAGQRRVELMAARRPFVLEQDLDGRGVRLVEPMGRVPCAVFTPGRAGGRVRLGDGAMLRWLTPSRAEFASGLVGPRETNIIRFALDGTALVFAAAELLDPDHTGVTRWAAADPGDACRGDAPDPQPGWAPDMVALLALSWFLRLLERPRPWAVRSGVR